MSRTEVAAYLLAMYAIVATVGVAYYARHQVVMRVRIMPIERVSCAELPTT
ncbi:MAG: hypothetical protein ACREMT_07765 [Vulcanimicrobiaceae bacterium]